jgi:hypothetical protein
MGHFSSSEKASQANSFSSFAHILSRPCPRYPNTFFFHNNHHTLSHPYAHHYLFCLSKSHRFLVQTVLHRTIPTQAPLVDITFPLGSNFLELRYPTSASPSFYQPVARGTDSSLGIASSAFNIIFDRTPKNHTLDSASISI